jgi:hypothetical protein
MDSMDQMHDDKLAAADKKNLGCAGRMQREF